MKTPRKPGGKVANSLVAMSSAAVMAVYSAGYVRTRSAAAQMEGQSEERRRPVAPTAPVAVAPVGAATVVPVAELKAEAPKAEAAVAGPTPVPVAKKDETLVAKGRAVDTAAKELAPFVNFAIDAGGDLYLGGANEHGMPWSVGVRHPRRDRELIDWLRVSNQAVCTSGDYEKDAPHILDPRNGAAAASVASATVVAPGALLADALATAAFVLGPAEGIRLLERMGVQGLILTPSLERFETEGLCHAA